MIDDVKGLTVQIPVKNICKLVFILSQYFGSFLFFIRSRYLSN